MDSLKDSVIQPCDHNRTHDYDHNQDYDSDHSDCLYDLSCGHFDHKCDHHWDYHGYDLSDYGGHATARRTDARRDVRDNRKNNYASDHTFGHISTTRRRRHRRPHDVDCTQNLHRVQQDALQNHEVPTYDSTDDQEDSD